MATVYLAADVKHDRMVALKVLRPELAAVLRFHLTMGSHESDVWVLRLEHR